MIAREQKISLIQSLVDMDIEIKEQSKAFEVLFGRYFAGEGGIPKLINDLLYKNIDLVVQLTGISKDAIEWYLFENVFEEDSRVCSLNGVDYVIDSVESFVDFESLEAGE